MIFSKIGCAKLKGGGMMNPNKMYEKFILKGWNDMRVE